MAVPDVIGNALEFIVPIASAGIVSMALVQSFKAIVPVQQKFQKTLIERWLLHGELGRQWLHLCIGEPADSKTMREFNGRAVPANWARSDSVRSFYSQDLKDIFEKLRMTGEMSIDYANTRSMSVLFGAIVDLLGLAAEDTAPWTKFLKGEFANGGTNGESNTSAEAETERVRAAQAARSLIQSMLRQHLSGIQLHLDQRWAQVNQITAVAISAYLLFWLSPFDSKQAFTDVSEHRGLLEFGYCMLGGVVAPFAKDLVTALVSAKSGKP